MKLKYNEPIIKISMFAADNRITTDSSITAEAAAKQMMNGRIADSFGADAKVSEIIEWNW